MSILNMFQFTFLAFCKATSVLNDERILFSGNKRNEFNSISSSILIYWDCPEAGINQGFFCYDIKFSHETDSKKATKI